MSLKQPVTLIAQSLIQALACVPLLLLLLIIYGLNHEGGDVGAGAMYGLFAIPGYVLAFVNYIIYNIIDTQFKNKWGILKHTVPLLLAVIGLMSIPSYKESSQQVLLTIIIAIVLVDLSKILYRRVLKTL